jgi:hypothetical protein
MMVNGVRDYFFDKKEKRQADFAINLDGKKTTFKQLPEELVREFREYAIPTIEIDLDDNSSLNEIINLFVDINQKGEKVKRFDIVKAIGNDNPLLSDVFDLIATKEHRKGDIFFKKKGTVFSRVLLQLSTVQAASDANLKVDRMWDRLVEIVLFCRTRKHRAPGQVLKSFISNKTETDNKAIVPLELKKLRACFAFLDKAYKDPNLGWSRMSRDLPNFYTMVTALLASDMLGPSNKGGPDYPETKRKLVAFARLLADGAKAPAEIADQLAQYKAAASRQTTHTGQRDIRQRRFLEILGKL